MRRINGLGLPDYDRIIFMVDMALENAAISVAVLSNERCVRLLS
jgi:hypothetical protein